MELLRNPRAQALPLNRTPDVHSAILIAALLVSTLVLCAFYFSLVRKGRRSKTVVFTYLKFAYSCFIKPHQATLDSGQQSALEGFYSTQVEFMSRKSCCCSPVLGCCVRCHPKATSAWTRGSARAYRCPVTTQTGQTG